MRAPRSVHPVREVVAVESPLPDDFAALLASLDRPMSCRARAFAHARLAAAGLDWSFPTGTGPPARVALSTTRNAGGRKIDLTRSILSSRLPAGASALASRGPDWLAQCMALRSAMPMSERLSRAIRRADGAVARAPNTVCAVHSADAFRSSHQRPGKRRPAAPLAGADSLRLDRSTLASMRTPPATVIAWLGPAIGRRPSKSASTWLPRIAR